LIVHGKWTNSPLQEFNEGNLAFGEVERLKLKNAIIVVLAATLIACILGAGYIDTAYLASMPRAPQPDTGRIYPVQLKSVYVYVNRAELNRAHLARTKVPIIGLCCFLGLVAIKQYWER
jgi:hypothetical protein